MQRRQIPLSLGHRNLITACYPAEADLPHLLPWLCNPYASRLQTPDPLPLFRSPGPARGARFSPRSPSQSRGSGKAAVHSSYSELACDSQQISDTQPKFRQVLGCSDVAQRLTNSTKKKKKKALLPDALSGSRFRVPKKKPRAQRGISPKVSRLSKDSVVYTIIERI